jgi:hypothetical protein
MEKKTVERLERAVASGVPSEAIGCYGRWWQLETFVREAVYTELRTKFGDQWAQLVDKQVAWRAEQDKVNRYMASADAEDLLAYADASVLFALIEQHWELFEPVLLPRVRWQGQVDTLRAIRNRIAHCRRPHVDDMGRIETLLRDLEDGARRFYGSYTETRVVRDGRDPLVKAWVKRRHTAAARLIEHCESSYETRFRLSYSMRPWAEGPQGGGVISGRDGMIWQAIWLTGGRELNPEELWRELAPRTTELILHMLFDGGGVTVTFASKEHADDLADAIGDVFDRLIETSRDYTPGRGMEDVDREIEQMRGSVGQLPAKVQYQSALCLFDSLNPDAFTLFGV